MGAAEVQSRAARNRKGKSWLQELLVQGSLTFRYAVCRAPYRHAGRVKKVKARLCLFVLTVALIWGVDSPTRQVSVEG